jgi:hypothetical protein
VASLASPRPLVAALAIALALALPIVTAQVGPINTGVTAVFDGPGANVGAGNTTLANVTVTNTGPAAGSVALALTVPAGWNATINPAQIPLAAGQSGTATVTIVAPSAKPGETNNGSLALAATFVETNTNRQATASASYQLTLIPVPLPPPPTPFLQTPLGTALIAGSLAVVLIGITAFIVLRQRRIDREEAERLAAEKAAREAYLARETGIGITLVDGPHDYGQRRELAWRIQIENRSDRDRVAVVEAIEAPPGWRAAPSLPKINLSPGQKIVITVVVTPEAGTPSGAAMQLYVRAKPQEALELDERITLAVVAPAAPAPLKESYRPVVVQRLGANQQPPPKK